MKKIFEAANSIQHRLVEHRRLIHANPELSFKEEETAKYVEKQLKEMGLDPAIGIGKTGVTVDIGDKNKGKTVAIRADMDALPINESNDNEYCSKNQGVMHACGHDAHTAMGLGAAEILAKNPPTNGCIRIVFQPAEEDTNEDGISGAGLMINDGAFNNVEAVFANHVIPEIEPGKIAVRSGPLLAACDRFDLKIKGKGTHGAYPQMGNDPIIIATHIIQAFQTIVSRKSSALEPLLITVGGIKSNTYRPNIISDSVEITGTIRYFFDTTKDIVTREIENIAKIAQNMGGDYELRYINENPAVVNCENLSSIVKETGSKILGKSNVVEAELQMGADDFSFLSQKMPACYFFLGAQIKESPRKLHTETFDINEDCMPIGTGILTASAINFLNTI